MCSIMPREIQPICFATVEEKLKIFLLYDLPAYLAAYLHAEKSRQCAHKKNTTNLSEIRVVRKQKEDVRRKRCKLAPTIKSWRALAD